MPLAATLRLFAAAGCAKQNGIPPAGHRVVVYRKPKTHRVLHRDLVTNVRALIRCQRVFCEYAGLNAARFSNNEEAFQRHSRFQQGCRLRPRSGRTRRSSRSGRRTRRYQAFTNLLNRVLDKPKQELGMKLTGSEDLVAELHAARARMAKRCSDE